MTQPHEPDSPEPQPEHGRERVVSISDEPEGSPGSDPASGQAAPYENLWVPLIVVPAGIVMALVAIFALFGTISSDEKSVEENLSLVSSGGANEREQALFGLMRQAAENNRARAEGEELPFPMGAEFVGKLRQAAEDLDADDHRYRLALAVLLSTLGDEQGVAHLMALMGLDGNEDPDGQLRIDAVTNLALLARHSPQLLDAEALAAAARPLLDNSDPGLRGLSAPLFGELGVEAGRKPLLELLGDSDLGVRFSAALALARLEPPEPDARIVLVDMTGAEIYAAANSEDPDQFRRPERVSDYRQWAVAALARYGDEANRSVFEGLLSDSDLRVREAAMIALKGDGGER